MDPYFTRNVFIGSCKKQCDGNAHGAGSHEMKVFYYRSNDDVRGLSVCLGTMFNAFSWNTKFITPAPAHI